MSKKLGISTGKGFIERVPYTEETKLLDISGEWLGGQLDNYGMLRNCNLTTGLYLVFYSKFASQSSGCPVVMYIDKSSTSTTYAPVFVFDNKFTMIYYASGTNGGHFCVQTSETSSWVGVSGYIYYKKISA